MTFKLILGFLALPPPVKLPELQQESPRAPEER